MPLVNLRKSIGSQQPNNGNQLKQKNDTIILCYFFTVLDLYVIYFFLILYLYSILKSIINQINFLKFYLNIYFVFFFQI